MAKKAAPPEVTGGKGFEYADQVAAWFLLQMLAGRQPLGSNYGTITSVHFEARESGWFLDDLLVNLLESGSEHSFAVSVKRRRQVTRSGFPRDFVRSVWEQWLDTRPECFERGRDLLGLATGQLADSVKGAWHDLVQEAISTQPERLAERLHTRGQTSALQRKLFASLQCPSDLQVPGETDEIAAVRLLGHLRLLHFDFREQPSDNRTSALAVCQEVLQSGDSAEAGGLWQAFVGIASRLRGSGGSASLQNVIRVLSQRFRLKDYPDHEHDWRQLERMSQEAVALVRGDIREHVLPRQDAGARIRSGIEKAKIYTLLGESGCGKSAIAKDLIRDPMISQRSVWLNGEILNHADMPSLEQRLGLNNPLTDVMRTVAVPRALVVIDGLDRFSPQALSLTSHLISSLGLDEEDSPWHVVITCQPENWQSILAHLTGHGVAARWFGHYVVELPNMREVDAFLKGFEGISLPTLSRDLRPVLRNLKVLDWVVNAASSDTRVDARGWVGVSDVVDWLWETWFAPGSNRYERAEAIKSIGEVEGDTLATGVSVRELTDSGRGVLPELEASGLIRVSEERVYFAHDLLGDWARMRIILGEQGSLADLLRQRASFPRWHRAIRLYAQRLLEQGGDDASQWRQVMYALRGESNDEVLVRDLFLEAIFFAVNADRLLDLVWPDLSADDGRLLVRLLKHFLHAATLPDPRLPMFVEDDKDIGSLSSVMRVPYWPRWPSMLCFLDRHREELTVEHHHPVAEICSLWLETTQSEIQPGTPWPWRSEAARMALRMAEEVRAAKALSGYHHFRDDTDCKVYEAALRGAPDLPDEVAQLALELCRRREESDEFKSAMKILEEQRERETKESLEELPDHPQPPEHIVALGPAEWPMRDPWPEGPNERVDNSFRKTVLETSALHGMMTTCPETAREILLAVCIEEPKPENPFDHTELMMDRLGTQYSPQMHPPMFFRGPFLQFLRLKPEEGLDTVFRLVNFATDRWLETQQKWAAHHGEAFDPSRFQVSVRAGGQDSEWIGDQRVYGWFRNMMISANLVASSLMAVEEWLYEQLDAERDIRQWADLMLARSRSVAFAGLLAEAAKKEPSLLAGPLMPLLGIWQIYEWDHYILANSDVWGIEMMSWSRSGERIFNLVRDWHAMPHRKQSLQQLAVYYLLTDEGVQKFFDETRERWAAELAADSDNETLELLIARLDPANYRASKGEDGRVYIGLEWPEHLRDRTETALRRSELGMEVLTFPWKCRQLLDGEKALEQGELPAFWDQLQKINAIEATEAPDLSRHRIEDAVCAGIAVLLTNHRAWLDQDAEKTAWCVERLVSIVESPPEPEHFAFPETVTTTDWSCFAGEVSVALLAENAEAEGVRRLVAESVAGYFHSTTALTMRAGYQFRSRIGDDFIRMQNIAVLWSALSRIMRRAEVLQVDRNRYLRWHQRLVRAFAGRAVPAALLPWDRVEAISCRLLERLEQRHRTRLWGIEGSGDEVIQEVEEADREVDSEDNPPVSPRRHRRSRSIKSPGFDPLVLQSAFAWLPSLSAARGAAERQVWIETWSRLLAVTLRMVEADDDEDESEELSDTPYPYDYWVFEGVARLMAQMEAGEKPKRFWEPILDLGPPAHYWVETFLQNWTISGPDAAESPAAFVERWRPMIKHCLASPAWSPEGRAAFRLNKMYIELMGLGLGSERIGRDEFADPMRSVIDLYERWAAAWLKDGYAMRHFTAFLTKPGAKPLVCPAVHWIRDAVVQYTDYNWRGFRSGEVESSIAEALWICWSQHRDAVQNDSALRNAFLELLKILASRLCRSAMELRDEVLRSLAR